MAGKKILTDIDIEGDVTADSFVKDGGTSSEFLLADGSVTGNPQLTTEEVQDIVGAMVASNVEIGVSVTYNDVNGTLNFHASEYTHDVQDGDDIDIDTGALTGATIISDLDLNVTTDTNGHVTDANATIATRELTLADLGFTGDSDANCMSNGKNTQVAFFIDDTDIEGDNGFTYDSTTNNLEVGNRVTATEFYNVPQVFNSNFAHTSGTSWVNVPFNSVADSATGGEVHFILAPYSGRIRRVFFKNTGSGTLPTATSIGFRILKNGVSSYTSSTLSVAAAYRMKKGFVLGDSSFLFAAEDDIRIQFISAGGLWQDVAASIVIEWTY